MTNPSRARCFRWALCAACVLYFAPPASAERVVLVAPQGELGLEQREELEGQLFEAIRASGHSPLAEAPGASEDHPLPTTGNEMRVVAELRSATYVVTATVDPAEGDRAKLVVRVGYSPDLRVEEVETEISLPANAERLRFIMQYMLRPEGLGPQREELSQALAKTTKPPPEDVVEPTAEEPPAPPVAPPPADPAKPAQAKQAQPPPQDAKPWSVVGALGAHRLIAHASQAEGGSLGFLNAILAYGPSSFEGLELRARASVMFLSVSGAVIGAGAAYVFPLGTPAWRVGGQLDVGALFVTTGAQGASFFLQASPVLQFAPATEWFIELRAPALTWITAGQGAAALGASAGAGMRF